jgi:hypothetical protein
MIEKMKLALEALENNRQTHYYCEDTWYSCPKHEDGCANDSEGDECTCGADKANVEIDAAITSLRQAIAELESQEPVAWQVKVYINNVWSPMGNPQLNKGRAEALASNPSIPKEKQRIVELFTHPPQEQQSCDKRTWVGLTGEDFSAIKFSVEMRFPAEFRAGARWADAYLKQKNGYAEEKNT